MAEREALELLREGWAQQRAGRYDAAEACYTRILALAPRQFDALHLLGLCRQQRGDFAGAEGQFRNALAQNDGVAIVHVNLGNALRCQGRWDDAALSYARAVGLDPKLAQARFHLAQCLLQSGRLAESLEQFDAGLAVRTDAPLLTGRAECLLAMGRAAEALEAFRKAVQQDPRFAEAHAGLGIALAGSGIDDAALVALEQALLILPELSSALAMREQVLARLVARELHNPNAIASEGEAERLYLRSQAMLVLGRQADAQALIESALIAQPTHRGARSNLAAMLVANGRTDQAQKALTILDALIAELPSDPKPRFNRGLQHYNLGEFARARADFEQALAHDPQGKVGKFNLGLLDLLEGNFESGWAGHEHRWDDPAAGLQRRQFAQSAWRGTQDIAGRTLLVHAEQGLGDTLQFSRYLPQLLATRAQVILEVQAPLVALLRRWLPPAIQVLARGSALPRFDLHCALLSLPGICGSRADSIPTPSPQVCADPALISQWDGRLGPARGPRVGIAWSGNPIHANDAQRSIPLASLQALFDQSKNASANTFGCEFLSLQNQLPFPDRQTLARNPEVQHFGDVLEDFEIAAGLLALCDVVVCVDTAALHLAASMGKPVLAMIPFVPDWRWMLGREDTPWYPSVRLFRQERPGAWTDVVRRTAAALPATIAAAITQQRANEG